MEASSVMEVSEVVLVRRGSMGTRRGIGRGSEGVNVGRGGTGRRFRAWVTAALLGGGGEGEGVYWRYRRTDDIVVFCEMSGMFLYLYEEYI